MKKYHSPGLLFLLFFCCIRLQAQHSPLWIQNLNTLPDSANLFPVKTMIDVNGDILVLCNYADYRSPQAPVNKIFLSKFDVNGILQWNYLFDTSSAEPVWAVDMTLDESGNCYIAGSYTILPSYKPLLFKVSPAGISGWQIDSTSAFNTGSMSQVLYRNGLLYLRHDYGVAMLDTNGVEVWSVPLSAACMTVDSYGRMLVAANMAGPVSVFRYGLNGSPDLSFPTISAERIAVDSDNNIYVFSQLAQYELMKYDSNGTFLWSYNDLPANTGFGDIDFKLLLDLYDDVLLVGLADTMLKIGKDGHLSWRRAMEGLDSYLLDAKIIYSNFLAVAGTVQTPQGSDAMLAIYDFYGNRNWFGIHNSNNVQEFAVSFAADVSGIYLLEDSMSNTGLIKFESPVFNLPVDYNFVCVDSVWYEPGFPHLINVRVFNGNFAHMNYPSVQIVSPAGDTIGNPTNFVNFFAHLGNDLQVYQDSITQSGIPDFSDYTFLINELFGDTTAVIEWCSTTGLNDIDCIEIILYPNPASSSISVYSPFNDLNLGIWSVDGKLCLERSLSAGIISAVDISSLQTGIYFARFTKDENVFIKRLVKLND